MWTKTIWHRLKPLPSAYRSKPMWVKNKRVTDKCTNHKVLYEGSNSRYESVWYTADDVDMQHVSTEKTASSK
jgi:hypothetical protein